MEKRHPGLKIRLVPSESQDIVAQIKAAQGASPYDAMPNDEPPHLIGIKDGYIQKARPERIPNWRACTRSSSARARDTACRRRTLWSASPTIPS